MSNQSSDVCLATDCLCVHSVQLEGVNIGDQVNKEMKMLDRNSGNLKRFSLHQGLSENSI